uniref:WD repeat-containing protein 76 n=1 Tax=Hyaloperonospora arabidopsidis (strain Emoy2) TaxID=559515 RepID=M4B5T5_HYAAE
MTTAFKVYQDNQKQHQDVHQLTAYERQRLEKIQRNLAFMQQMGVSTAKIAARTAIDAKASAGAAGYNSSMSSAATSSFEAKRQQRAAIRAMQAVRKAERLSQPIRKSRRLEGKKVEVQPIESIDQFELHQMRSSSRRLSRGSSSNSNFAVVMDAVDGESRAFLDQFVTVKSEDEALEKDAVFTEDDSDEDDAVDNEYRVEYTLADEDVVKAVQARIYSMAFLPRADRVVVACGDKMGHVALWTPLAAAKMKHESAVSPLAVYRPHENPVSQLIFSDSSKLVSSSFDGTVREFDLRAAKSLVIYDTSEDAGISSLATASMAQCYYASCDDGTVRLIDRRAQNVQSSRYQLHEKKINTVHKHPSLDFCIATASLDRTVCLWDARKMSTAQNVPLVTLPHYRSVNCAYFSPRDGAWLVTVGQDSFVDMFDMSSLTEHKLSDELTTALPKPIRVRHNNMTGRWLTKLHAAWDPKRPKHFVLGCLDQPRRIQIFRAGRRRPVRELMSDNFASVHSINAFHPHLELIAGGNSSGRLALWRGKRNEKDDDVKAEVKSHICVKTE